MTRDDPPGDAAGDALLDALRPGGRFDDWSPQPPAFVVADVDGTLVGPTSRASEEVAAAVARAQSSGLDVGFATGRMRLAVEPLWEQLRANGPHVFHNGAEVRWRGDTLAAFPLRPRDVDAVLGIARDLDRYVEVYVPDGFLVNVVDERARPHWGILGHEPLGEIHAAAELAGRDGGDTVFKVTFALFDGRVDDVVGALEDAGLRAGPAGSPLTPDIEYVNGTNPEADKGSAVRAAADALDVPIGAVVAIGDARNDLPLLEVAGTAVAMGQAPEDVRAAAHLVAPDVGDHGVATVLDACVRWRAEAGR